MIKLKKETDLLKNVPFLSVSQFKNEKVILNSEIITYNSIIKGIRRSGKTEKVLIPAFELCESGVLYVDYNNEAENIIKKICEKKNRTVHVFYNKDVNIQKIIEYILKGHIVYFNIRQGKENDLEYLNLIFKGIYENSCKIKDKVNILIDNIQYLGRINNLEDLIVNCNNVKILMTLCYTRQIQEFYGETITNIIKENCYSYDVEKQQK